jgi:hypothetical protein
VTQAQSHNLALLLSTQLPISPSAVEVASFRPSVRPGDIAYDCAGPQVARRSSLGAAVDPQTSQIVLHAALGAACVFAPFHTTDDIAYLSFAYRTSHVHAAVFCVWTGTSCATRMVLPGSANHWKRFAGLVSAVPGTNWLYLYARSRGHGTATSVTYQSVTLRTITRLPSAVPLLAGET